MLGLVDVVAEAMSEVEVTLVAEAMGEVEVSIGVKVLAVEASMEGVPQVLFEGFPVEVFEEPLTMLITEHPTEDMDTEDMVATVAIGAIGEGTATITDTAFIPGFTSGDGT